MRKQYQSGIELAKKQRKELRKQIGVHSVNMPNSMKQTASASSEGKRDLSIQDVIQFLEQFKEAPSAQEFQLEREKLKEQIQSPQKELEDLRSENQTLRNQLEMTEEDYKALIDIMDRARKMVVSKEDGRMKKAAQET